MCGHSPAKLTVVPMQGWRRDEFFDQTGVKWVNPSPNLRSVEEAALYPGIGMLEANQLSVGRGTATPFEVFGAGATAATKDAPAQAGLVRRQSGGGIPDCAEDSRRYLRRDHLHRRRRRKPLSLPWPDDRGRYA